MKHSAWKYSYRHKQLALSMLCALLLCCARAHGLDCAALPHANHPSVTITNGRVTAVVFLPDAKNGYYRSTRFDWSGVVGCASLHGHVFWGEWFDKYDPAIPDAITGPVEEFRTPGTEIGYNEAGPNGVFVKLGVGVLRRTDDSPYSFRTVYPIVDTGTWTVRSTKNSVTFRQVLRSPIGIAYAYEKTLTLEMGNDVLVLHHRLTNLGTKLIESRVYDHDFYTLDRRATGPGIEVTFPFSPVAAPPFPRYAETRNSSIIFNGSVPEGKFVWTHLSGFSLHKTGHLSIVDHNSGIRVDQSWNLPIQDIVFWADPHTICPEIYLPIHVRPGGSQTWTIQYHLHTP